MVRVRFYPGAQHGVALLQRFPEVFAEGLFLLSLQSRKKIEIVMHAPLSTHDEERHHPGVPLMNHLDRPYGGTGRHSQKGNHHSLIPGILIKEHSEKLSLFKALQRSPKIEPLSQGLHSSAFPKRCDAFGYHVILLVCPDGIHGISHTGDTGCRKFPVSEMSGKKDNALSFGIGCREMGLSVDVHVPGKRVLGYREP